MVGGSLRVLRLLPPLKLVAMISWNIAESGIKHQRSDQILQKLHLSFFKLYYDVEIEK
jgi:hypothetical protein